MLLLDESADAKAGTMTAGSGRLYNGRLGKVDVCQGGVFLTFVKGDTWTWVAVDLFLQEHWFEAKMAKERQRLGIPSERTFKTKLELGCEMIRQAQVNGGVVGYPQRIERGLPLHRQQCPARHAVGESGLDAMPALLRRAQHPGCQVGNGLGQVPGPEVPCLGTSIAPVATRQFFGYNTTRCTSDR